MTSKVGAVPFLAFMMSLRAVQQIINPCPGTTEGPGRTEYILIKLLSELSWIGLSFNDM